MGPKAYETYIFQVFRNFFLMIYCLVEIFSTWFQKLGSQKQEKFTT